MKCKYGGTCEWALAFSGTQYTLLCVCFTRMLSRARESVSLYLLMGMLCYSQNLVKQPVRCEWHRCTPICRKQDVVEVTEVCQLMVTLLSPGSPLEPESRNKEVWFQVLRALLPFGIVSMTYRRHCVRRSSGSSSSPSPVREGREE